MKNYFLFGSVFLYGLSYGQTDTTKHFNNDELIYTVVEEMPQFPGGNLEFAKYIDLKLKKFKLPKEVGLSGKCFTKFVVDIDGSVKDVSILKGVPNCPTCDEEAKTILLDMPKWKSGKQNGKSVAVYYNQAINFKLR